MLSVFLVLLVFSPTPVQAQPYSGNVARAESYLLHHLDPSLGLVYESEDPGVHWLSNTKPDFHWHYNQSYWLYSDNLFVALALAQDYPQISETIFHSINRFQQPPADLFEVVAGQRIPMPVHDAENYIVARAPDYVILIRRHNSTRFALGVFVDLWMYEALEYALEGNLATARSLVQIAASLWHSNGLYDWSFTIFDHMFSNQKLALLLFTARAIGVTIDHENEMEAHLWSMQNGDGGIASLSFPTGKKAGSANAETTALTLLIYNESLLSKFPKIQTLHGIVPFGTVAAVNLMVMKLDPGPHSHLRHKTNNLKQAALS
jgi:hypothetical protein